MNVQKILDQANEQGIVAISAAVDELKRWGEESEREASAAYKAYFSDVEEREAKVKLRLADLAQQEEGIKQKVSAIQPGLVDATVSGNSDAFHRIQETFASLEAQRAAIATQMQLLSSAQLPGNLGLYKAAETKHETSAEVRKQLQADIEVIRSFVSEQAEAWDKLKNELYYVTFHTPGCCSTDFIKVDTHFRHHRLVSNPS